MADKKGIWIDRHTFVEFSNKTTSSLSQEIATRDRSIDFYSLGMYLPNPDPVLKKRGKDIKVYTELLVDGHLGGCVSSREAGVRSLEWEIDRGKSKSRQAKIITDLFTSLDMDRIISEILRAPLFGYQVMEVIWEKAGNYILPKDIVGKPQHWFTFYADDNSLRLLTKSNMITGEPVPEKKFLVARHQATYDNPYGFPALSRCFWPVTFKKGGVKFWVVFAEKYGMPFLWGKLPRGMDQKEYDNLADILENMVKDAIAVTPDDASVELLTTEGRANGDIYKGLIEECKTEISIAVLGQNLTTQVTGGSLAATEGHLTVRKDITDGDKKIVEQTFKELITWIYELNFSAGDMPVFSMYEEEDVDATLATRDGVLSRDCGVKFSPQYFQREYGFEDGDIESVSLSGPQPQGIAFSERRRVITPPAPSYLKRGKST